MRLAPLTFQDLFYRSDAGLPMKRGTTKSEKSPSRINSDYSNDLLVLLKICGDCKVFLTLYF